MNIKLHTPKSLKMGSGMSSVKQFLLSLFATSVSIALTFGTAGYLDYKKKQSEKREIVMMVMYDMYNSLQAMQKADSMLLQAMQIQKQIAQDSTKFNDLRLHLERCCQQFALAGHREDSQLWFLRLCHDVQRLPDRHATSV